ncbi:MAG: N-formylglutamate amidohydrolase [Luteolibacter sp.]|jgi:hypothetical protein
MTSSILVSCEHATCAVPGGQRAIFEGREDELHSEAGWEPGALNLAQGFAMAFRTPLVHGEITRLLIDLEADEETRWGKYADELSDQSRERFSERMWKGYRATLRQRIEEDLRRHDVVTHVFVHVIGSEAGRVTLRVPEGADFARRVAVAWADAIRREHLDSLCVTGGIPAGLVHELAAGFPADRYLPIRLEVAAAYFLEGRPLRWDACKTAVIKGLGDALQVVCQ